MDDLVVEFLAETNESLGELDNALIQLEQNPTDEALISQIFRVLHTIKGTSGFLGLTRLGTVAHKGEDLLGLFREKKLQVTPAYITLILEAFDVIKMIISDIQKTGGELPGDDSDIINRLEAVCKLPSGGAKAPPKEAPPKPAADAEAEAMAAAIAQAEEEERRAAQSFATASERKQKEIEAEIHEPGKAGPAAAASAGVPAEAQSLRVSVDVLENLMTVVSELVLTRNQILQTARQMKDSELQAPLQRLNLVVSELQESVMKTRMQPVGNAWSKLPRIVRDICAELGKKIDLEMRGQETELDRQVLEMIKDPLMHMVRNSADHGIEKPADRLASGKSETGHILLNSFHQGGHIIIEISDDGKGLSLEKIKSKAIQNGLATPEQLAQMTPQQIQQFIFHAGFSTAEKVTSVSGRGVGMDVVRANIQKIGGAIEMKSVEGKGTTFTIKIPLTLAIISALIVEVAGSRFAIPQLAVSELVMVGPGSSGKIETVDDSPVLRLRENLLPLIYLGDQLKLLNKDNKMQSEEKSGVKYVVVVRVASFQFGLIVDHVLDMEEIVVKPVSRNIKKLEMFSGNTILGDGSVIMILDPAGLLRTVGMQDMIEQGGPMSTDDVKLLESQSGPENLLLLFKAGNDSLKAAPLEMVSRLEELDLEEMETANGRYVIQYLGHLMPIFSYNDQLPARSRVPLIIFKHEGKNVGLIADQIIDVAVYRRDYMHQSENKLLDSIIINDEATDIVNPVFYTKMGVTIPEAKI